MKINTFRRPVSNSALLISALSVITSAVLLLSAKSESSTKITSLRVAHNIMPLAVEDKQPVFSWQMESNVTGQKQSAYQIIVSKETDKKVVWNSGKVKSGLSHEIRYAGSPLEAETAYKWNLTVWDARGKKYTASSRFETGLMNPDIKAWDGAVWTGSNQLILDAASAMLFEINTTVQIKPGSRAASIVFGANDFRLRNKFLNIENIEGENYVRFELDVSGAGTETGAVLNIYRVGYAKNDSPDVPFRSISKATYPETNLNDIITGANKHDIHNISIRVSGSNITMKIDSKDLMVTAPPASRTQGQQGGGVSFSGTGQPTQGFRAGGSSLSISNYRTGGNFNTWPNLNSIGFACRPGDEVLFTDFKVLASGRADPKNNVLFGREAGATYAIFKNLPGVTVTGNGIINIKNNTDRTIVGYADPSHGSLTMMRTEFATKAGRKPVRAKMYVTSMGSCEVFINGKRMGEDWFIPGSTQFRETIGYYAYDVTSMIKQGENCIGALLSPGWYTGYMTFTVDNYNFFGDTEALLAKLVITYDDGIREVVTTRPEKWRVWKNGPVEYGSFFQGERYNAKKEAGISVNGNVNGWSTCEYDDSRWAQAETVNPREWIKPGIVARFDQPVRIAEVLTARKVMPVHSDDNHTFTYDMGVNMVGVPSITVPAGWLKEGDVVILRYGEQLYPGLEGDEQEYIDLYGYTGKGKGIAGRILTETYRAALATDFYTAKGSGEVVIQPLTTYRGYQYIQITIPGHTGPLPVENVKGLVLSSGPVPDGTYEAVTADGSTGELVNRLFKNIQRSQLGNFFTIPTDCPQRNERMGWTGDAQAYSRTATYNADVRNFFRQWMVALRNDQTTSGGIGSTVPSYNTAREESFPDGTTWAGAVCMVPWQLYTQYGDLQTVQENMPAMKAWLEGMARFPFNDEYPHLSARTSGLADWLAVDRNTPSDLVNNAIYIYLMEVTAVMAEAVGDREYAGVLRQRHAVAKEEWNKCYVDPATGKTRNSKGALVHSQTSYATPLNFNTFSDSNLKKAQDYLAELAVNPSASGEGKSQYPSCSITTGFSGTPNILPALSRAGKANEAYCMFTCTDYASWLYPLIKGATSVWERWNGYEMAFRNGGDNSMNSFNHFALGAAGQWMYEFQLGITTDHGRGEAGYKHFVLQPSAGKGFTSLKGSYNSLYGKISSSWTADGNGSMTSYSATVPANTGATLYLPVSESAEEFLQAKGAVFKGKGFRNNISVAIYELESGSFRFTITGKGVTAESL